MYSQMYVFTCMLACVLVHVYMCMLGAKTVAKGEPLYVCRPSHPKPLPTEGPREGQSREKRQRAGSSSAAAATVGRCPRRPPLHILFTPSGEVGSSPAVGKPPSPPQA